MNGRDQQKLIKAGFTILRKEKALAAADTSRIKMKGPGANEWKTFEKGFKSVAQLDRRMSELLKDDKTIED